MVGDGSSIEAMNPKGRQFPTIQVKVPNPERLRHLLFKAEGDTHGRRYPESELECHFRPTLGCRLDWIQPTLLNPQLMYYDTRAGHKTHFYCSQTIGSETFTVLVAEYATNDFCFITATPYTYEDWKSKRLELRRNRAA